MSELTREQIKRMHKDAIYQHSLKCGPVVDLCNMALRTLDAEQRAKQAEADHAEAVEECRYHMDKRNEYRDEARRMAAQRDTARQEAAKLREALKNTTETVEEYLEPCLGIVRVNRDDALHSSSQISFDVSESTTSDAPASEPEDDRVCVICDGGPGNNCQCACGEQKWDRPEPPLREVAMRAAAGYDSPHPDEDRPQTDDWSRGHTMAKEAAQTDAQREALENLIEEIRVNGMNDESEDELRSHLSQSGQAVPEAVRRLPDDLRRTSGIAREIPAYRKAADMVERAITEPTHPADGDSPAVVGGWKLVPKEDYQAHTKMARHFVAALPSDLRPERGSSLEPFVAAMYDAIAAAPTPDEDGESDE